MGAGSKYVSQAQINEFKSKPSLHKPCHHHLLPNMKIGVCKFLNTGRPYVILECSTCHSEFVQDKGD